MVVVVVDVGVGVGVAVGSDCLDVSSEPRVVEGVGDNLSAAAVAADIK